MARMNEERWTEYVIDLYDKEVMSSGGDGMKRPDAVRAILPKVKQAVEDDHLDLPPIDLERLITNTVTQTDLERNRKRRFADLLPLLTGNRDDETILNAEFDPWMQQAWALGGGVRRAGKFLSIPDIDAIMSNKRRNVTAATAVYEEEADAADQIKAIMRAGNHAHLGDIS